MLNVFLKQESHTHRFVLALTCRKPHAGKHFSIFYVTYSLKMVNKETWQVIDLTWRAPILFLHCFWSYTIPSACSVNPLPWVNSLIMALPHQYFTVQIIRDNNLIASQSLREKCLRWSLQIDVCSSVERVHNQCWGASSGKPFWRLWIKAEWLDTEIYTHRPTSGRF